MTMVGDDVVVLIPGWWVAPRRLALATVIRTWGGSPRAVGSQMLVDDTGRFEGSVSGGCIESAVIHESEGVLADEQPRRLTYTVGNERAWEVGLSCGGRVEVYLEPVVDQAFWRRLLDAKAAKRRVARLVRLTDGAQFLVDEAAPDMLPDLPVEARAQLKRLFQQDTGGVLETEAGLWFLCCYPPCARLLVVGGVHIAQALIPMAETAGFQTTLVDPRTAFASASRFPGVTMVHRWPEEAFEQLQPDRATYVVTLTHDPKLDDPALVAALRSQACYIGSLGSRRTHEKRLARLEKLGFDQAALARIHGPAGLALGGRKPSQIAVSILAQMIQVTYNP